MPRMTTLSLMPFAMADLSSSTLGFGRDRRGFPVVAAEAAGGVDVLDAEHHLHGLADLQCLGVDVGEVDHDAAALLELDHAVAGRRIGRVGQAVGRIGLDSRAHVGEGVRLLGADGVAVGIDADVGLRKLQRAALGALAAGEARHRLAVAPHGRERRALVGLRAHAALELDQVVEGEVAAVARLLLAAGEMADDAAVLGPVGDLRRRLEQQGVGALAEAHHQDLVAGLGLLEGGGQQQQGMRGAGVAAVGMQRIADGLVVDARRLGDRAGDARRASPACRSAPRPWPRPWHPPGSA